jgi:hypothetical protein
LEVFGVNFFDDKLEDAEGILKALGKGDITVKDLDGAVIVKAVPHGDFYLDLYLLINCKLYRWNFRMDFKIN